MVNLRCSGIGVLFVLDKFLLLFLGESKLTCIVYVVSIAIHVFLIVITALPFSLINCFELFFVSILGSELGFLFASAPFFIALLLSSLLLRLLLVVDVEEEERAASSDPTRIDVVVILEIIERRCEFTGDVTICVKKKE